ncbi:MAG TPA: pyridoxamine 5'-phosphate oxidase family protein, partial [Phycisphaerales bacterium]|nr:pyridoxamine 5'-phosphate oxidase family protein [Phycisphaerales bacterium]
MKTQRTTVRRHPERGEYDRETIHRIIDEALICHLAIVDDGQPFVMPVIHTRVDENLYFHGSRGSRLLQAMAAGAPACATMTIIDGLVLARAAMHHSMNYRS